MTAVAHPEPDAPSPVLSSSPVDTQTAIATLRGVGLFQSLSDNQLATLAAAGELMQMQPGTELFHEAAPAEFWWVLIDGSAAMTRHIGSEDLVLTTLTDPGQWAGGLRAWDQNAVYLGTARCVTTGTVLRTPSAELRRIAESWFPFGVHIISGLMQTVRRIESMARQREKLIALGTLSAGLAHELNNPASAATRAVDALSDATEMLIGAIGPLGGSALSAEQCAALEGLRQEAMTASPGGDGSSLRESDREDAIADWLDDHGVDRSWVIAAALAGAGVDDSFCERVLDAVGPDALGPGLQLLAGSVSTGQLLAEVRDATSRISGLVGAVKSYSQMDRASVQLTNVVDGLESTLVMLTHKLRGVDVHREWAADLPKVKAIPGELNQVWTNLIDNAVDAMGGSGTLEVTARVDGDRLVVAVVDDGPGMSAEVLERAFDPFFTTKEVGKGTGLGLDISRRIVVEHHSGDISIDSQPGRTSVSVALPLVH